MNKTEKLIKQANLHIWLAKDYLKEDGGDLLMVIKHLNMAKDCIVKLLGPMTGEVGNLYGVKFHEDVQPKF